MPKASRINFYGGMNQRADPAKLDAQTEYYLLINGRNRRNRITPIAQPLNITLGLPSGKAQGFYAFNQYLVAVIAGVIYYKNPKIANSVWTRIDGATFSPSVDRIYIEPTPGSSNNLARTSAGTVSPTLVSFQGPISSSPFVGVIMDGVSQPGLLSPNATLRYAQTYADWTPQNPEYIPVGTIPMSIGTTLYCAVQDPVTGLFTAIARSVSGQPLNFVIGIDQNGGKLSSNESKGGALLLPWNVDMAPLSALRKVSATAGSFIAATQGATYLVSPDYTKPTVFAEPQFKNQLVLPIGPVNNDSFADMLGDVALIFPFGVTTFNSVNSDKFAGKNSIFSSMVDDLLVNIVQTVTAATNYQTYAVFAVQTRYGSGVLWYDQVSKSWASLDILDGVGQIRQFAVQQTLTGYGLFFYDSNNQFFEYFGGGYTAATRIYFNEGIPSDTSLVHALQTVKVQFAGGTISTQIDVSTTADRQTIGTKAALLKAQMPVGYQTSPQIPLQEPLPNDRELNPASFDFTSESTFANRVGLEIAWRGDAELFAVGVETEERPDNVKTGDGNSAIKQQAQTTICFIGNAGNSVASKLAIVKAIQQENSNYVVDLGNSTANSGAGIIADLTTFVNPFWSSRINSTVGSYFSVTGTNEMSVGIGALFFEYLRYPARYNKIVLPGSIELYLLSAGFDSGLVQREPGNLDGASLVTSSQIKWLANQLSLSTASVKLVAWSYPQYSSYFGQNAGTIATQSIDFKALGATALLSGQAPAFEHVLTNGFSSFTVGSAAVNLLPATQLATSLSYLSKPGYLKATIFQLSIIWEYKAPNGDLLYRFRQAIQ